MPEVILQMKGINKKFGSNQVLSDVNLTLHCGEVLGLLGENGAGKSTLMNHLIGEKIAIISNKPQTTRNKITSILTKENFLQYQFY